MKKITKKLAAAALAATMLLPTAAMAAIYNDDGDIMIRVGLASSSGHNAEPQRPCFHLQNVEDYGSGYRFGYYDEDLNFEELAYTDEDVEHLSIMRTTNMAYGYNSSLGSNTYLLNGDGKVRVGSFHVELDEEYSSYKKALREAEDYDGGFVAWINGEYRVRVGAFFTKEEAEELLEELDLRGARVTGTSSYGIHVVETGTDNILFQYDEGEGTRLAILPDVTDEDEPQTWFRGYRYLGGFTYQRLNGGDLTVVNVLPLEDYVRGVTPYEMGRSWPLEALKTQATCARTYAMKNLDRHNSLGFDVCNSDSCQVYYGMGSLRKDFGPTQVSDQAVEETAGQVVWYEDELAATYYSSSHGGASEAITNIWGGSLDKTPYLCGVVDPYEQEVKNSNAKHSWTVKYARGDLSKRLQGRVDGAGDRLEALELTYSPLGNVIKVVAIWNGNQRSTFKPDAIRSAFGLSSIRFTVNGVTVDGTAVEDLPGDSVNRFTLNEDDSITFGEDFEDELYVITEDGEVETIAQNPYVITGSGKKQELLSEEEPEQSAPTTSRGGTVRVSGSNYVFQGSGWGHQIGMSQYGAYAMSNRGFDFDEIIEFYYPGTHVDDYED